MRSSPRGYASEKTEKIVKDYEVILFGVREADDNARVSVQGGTTNRSDALPASILAE